MRETNTKEQHHALIAQQTQAFLDKGGVIELLPPLEYTHRLFTVAVKGTGNKGDELMLYSSKRSRDGVRTAYKVGTRGVGYISGAGGDNDEGGQ